jgi:hypothetical protein
MESTMKRLRERSVAVAVLFITITRRQRRLLNELYDLFGQDIGIGFHQEKQLARKAPIGPPINGPMKKGNQSVILLLRQ